MATRTKGKSQPEMPTKTLIASAILSSFKENPMSNSDDAFAFALAYMQQQSAMASAMNIVANMTIVANAAKTETQKETAMTAHEIISGNAAANIAEKDTAMNAIATAADTAAETAIATDKDTAMLDTNTATAATTYPSIREALIAKGLSKPEAEKADAETAVETVETAQDDEAAFWNAVEKYHGMREDAPRSFAKAVADGEVPEDVLIELARRDAITAQNALFAYQDTETFFATVDAPEEAEKAEKIEPDAVADLDAAASNAENTLYELIKRTRTIAVENAKLMAQLEKLAAKNAALEAENSALKAQVAEQQESLESKDALIDELRGSINEQSEEIASKGNLIAVMQQQIEANDLALKQKSADEAAALEMARQAEDEAAMLKAAIMQRDAEANALKAAVHTASNDAAAKAAVLQEKLANIAKMLS